MIGQQIGETHFVEFLESNLLEKTSPETWWRTPSLELNIDYRIYWGLWDVLEKDT